MHLDRGESDFHAAQVVDVEVGIPSATHGCACRPNFVPDLSLVFRMLREFIKHPAQRPCGRLLRRSREVMHLSKHLLLLELRVRLLRLVRFDCHLATVSVSRNEQRGQKRRRTKHGQHVPPGFLRRVPLLEARAVQGPADISKHSVQSSEAREQLRGGVLRQQENLLREVSPHRPARHGDGGRPHHRVLAMRQGTLVSWTLPSIAEVEFRLT